MIRSNEFTDRAFTDYKEYKDYLESMQSNEICFDETIVVCNELTAVLYENIAYSDRKLFNKDGHFYKPSKIVVTPKRQKPQLLGLVHNDEDLHFPDVKISPIETLDLMSACESFASNKLSKRVYRRESFSFYMIDRENEKILCIDYGEELKKATWTKYTVS